MINIIILINTCILWINWNKIMNEMSFRLRWLRSVVWWGSGVRGLLQQQTFSLSCLSKATHIRYIPEVHDHFLSPSRLSFCLLLSSAAMEVCWQIQRPASLRPGFQEKGRVKINTFSVGFFPRSISSVNLFCFFSSQFFSLICLYISLDSTYREFKCKVFYFFIVRSPFRLVYL